MGGTEEKTAHRSFIVLGGSLGTGRRAVARALIRLAGRGVALDAEALLQMQPHPATREEEITWLTRLLPGMLQTYLDQGVELVALAASSETPDQVRALRACVAPLIPSTAAWRLVSTPNAVRSRFLGRDAGKRFELWRTLHEQQEQAARRGDMGRPIDTSDADAGRVAREIWADRNRPVHVVPHEAAWHDAYAGEVARLRVALGERLGALHHVGSTAVQGLHAKPIIDLMAEVEHLPFALQLVGPLFDIGYLFNDHPENTERMIFTHYGPSVVHLHIVEAGSEELRRHLAFRDALRMDVDLRDAYGQLKQRLAREYPSDRHGYTEAKSEFIRAAERRVTGASSPG